MSLNTNQLISVYLVIITILLSSCDNGQQLERSSVSGRKPGTGDAAAKNDTIRDTDDDRDETESTGNKKKKKKKTDDPDDEESDAEDNSDEADAQIEYPQLGFRGDGYTTYKLKDRLKMKMDLETQMDDNKLSINTTTAKVECGSKSGCDQKDVDKKVNATSLGANVYNRISKDEIKTLKKENYEVPSYSIFAGSVRGKNGVNFTFSKPLPVYPWPGPASRYDELDRGAGTWTVTVTADQHIPNDPEISIETARTSGEALARSGKAVKQFDVTVTVSKVAGAGDEVTLKIETTIPADKKRVLYEHFPLPRASEYTINTDTKNITQVFTTNWSNGDRSKDPEESVLTYKICTSKTKDETKQFACQ